MPLGGGVRGAFGDGAGVTPVRGGAGRGHHGPVALPAERAGVGGEFGVDGGPVRGAQARGFAHEQGGAPFVELPGLQGGEGVRHLSHEGFGQAEEPAAPGRGFAPGQGDLRADPGAELLGRDPGRGLFAALEQVEGHGEPGLFRGRGGLPVFQFPDPVNDPGTVRGRTPKPSGPAASRPATSEKAASAVPGMAAASLRGAAEAGVAVSCRSHFGPVIAVHEPSVSGASDNNAPVLLSRS